MHITVRMFYIVLIQNIIIDSELAQSQYRALYHEIEPESMCIVQQIVLIFTRL